MFAGVGERTREGNDLFTEMTESGVIENTALVFGQMDEPPGTRMRVALSALTMAEYFRDVQNQDVLLFIDNIFRFTQAGSEVSTLLGRMPSAVGYQPTLADEMGELQERITSTRGRSITSMQAIYVPADDYTDPAPHTTFAHLDATTELSRADLREGHLPGGGPAGLDLADPRPAVRRRGALPTSPSEVQADPAALQGPAGHHRHPRHRRARPKRTRSAGQPGPAHRALPVAEHAAWPSSSPASRAPPCRSRRPSSRSTRSPRASSTTCPSRRSSCAAASRTWSATGKKLEGSRQRRRWLRWTSSSSPSSGGSGRARRRFVFARTTVGEIGILPGHEQTLAQLEEAGIVRIDGVDGPPTTVAVHGGFLHVTPETSRYWRSRPRSARRSTSPGRARRLSRADEFRARGCGRRGARPGDGSKPRAPSRRRRHGGSGVRRRHPAAAGLSLPRIPRLPASAPHAGRWCGRVPAKAGSGPPPRSRLAGRRGGLALRRRRYQGNEFAWYRLTSLRPGATAVLDRTGVEIVERRHPESAEAYALPQAASVLRCRMGEREIELAMTPGVLTGFLSWLESAPPGGLPRGVLRPLDTPDRPGCQSTSPSGVRHPAEDEQQVREPVEVARRQRVGALGVGLEQRPHRTLGPPRHRAGDVQVGRARGAAGQDERARAWAGPR